MAGQSGPQVEVCDAAVLVQRHIALGDFMQRRDAAAARAAGLAGALVLEKALSDGPADIQLAEQGVLGRNRVGDEGFAEG